jgi:hypothetical protein
MTEEERDRSAPAKSPSHGRSVEDFEVSEIPEFMYKKTPCDLHFQAYQDFCGECSDEPSQSRQSQPMSPDLGHRSASPSSEEVRSDRDDSHGDSYSSREYVDESEDDDLDDNLSHDSEDNESNHLEEDEDGGNQSSWSDEVTEEEEYDMEEMISKDHTSQRRMQRIEIDDQNRRTIVSIVDDNRPAQNKGDSPQCEVIAHASGTTSQSTVERLTSSPSTPKGTSSSRCEADSSRKTVFRVHYERSPSDRTLRTVNTISADPSYDEGVENNEEVVRKRILESFASGIDDLGSAREGFVYAFRDNELPLIKIGFTAGTLHARQSRIEKRCGFVKGLTLVDAVKVKAYKQLERIVHQDLAPHRVYFDCACGKIVNKKGFSRHQEYFQIDDDTAQSTLRLWRDFVEQRPWERHSLEDEWYLKVSARSKVDSSETHTSHDERVKRWRDHFGILESAIDNTKRPSKSPLTARSTATERNILAGTTKVSPEDCTPSKPPRVSVEDVAEEDRPSITCPLSLGPSKRSPSSEPAGLAHVQDTDSTARGLTRDLPHRTKNTGLTSDGPSLSDNMGLQVRGTSNGQSVRSAEKKSISIFASTLQAPPHNSDSTNRASGNTTLAEHNAGFNPDRVATSMVQDKSVDSGPFSHIQFPPLWCPPNQIPPAKSDSNENSKPPMEKMVSAPEHDAAKLLQHEAQPIPKTLPPQKQQEHAVTVLTSPFVQSAFELAKVLLAKEVQPLPARAISDDLWQLRWPLACSVAFALQSPHIPAGLSLLMWSVFLPFFVAELRGWTLVGHA